VGNHRIQRGVRGRNTVHGYRLKRIQGKLEWDKGEKGHTAYFDGCFEFEKDWLVDENLAGTGAEILDLILLELDGLSGSISTDCYAQGESAEEYGSMQPPHVLSQCQMAPGPSWGHSPSSKRSMTESRSISVVDSAIKVIQLPHVHLASILILACARKRLYSPDLLVNPLISAKGTLCALTGP